MRKISPLCAAAPRVRAFENGQAEVGGVPSEMLSGGRSRRGEILRRNAKPIWYARATAVLPRPYRGPSVKAASARREGVRPLRFEVPAILKMAIMVVLAERVRKVADRAPCATRCRFKVQMPVPRLIKRVVPAPLQVAVTL